MNRRGFLGAILAAGAAPSIVRAESIMRVRPPLVAPGLSEWVLEEAPYEVLVDPFSKWRLFASVSMSELVAREKAGLPPIASLPHMSMADILAVPTLKNPTRRTGYRWVIDGEPQPMFTYGKP